MPNTSKVEVYRDADGQWRWRKRGGNGETIFASTEGYEHRQHAIDQAQAEGVGDDVNTVLVVLPE